MWNKLYFANQMKPAERKFKFHQKALGGECYIHKGPDTDSEVCDVTGNRNE